MNFEHHYFFGTVFNTDGPDPKLRPDMQSVCAILTACGRDDPNDFGMLRSRLESVDITQGEGLRASEEDVDAHLVGELEKLMDEADTEENSVVIFAEGLGPRAPACPKPKPGANRGTNDPSNQ